MMSVKLKKNPGEAHSRLEITSEYPIDSDQYISRMRALIAVLQRQDHDFADKEEETYHVLEILNDMLPNYEQAKKMFNSPH